MIRLELGDKVVFNYSDDLVYEVVSVVLTKSCAPYLFKMGDDTISLHAQEVNASITSINGVGIADIADVSYCVLGYSFDVYL